MSKPVVLFDGVCNLCNGVVRILIPRDPQKKLMFANLQSDYGQRVLIDNHYPLDEFDSFILIENELLFNNSTAALRLLAYLKFPWPLFKILLVIPAPIRDYAYSFVARNRYRWFGRMDICPQPTPELQSRFLS
ncbi:MAG: DCC1-like thiol-disulfide oxidoreductase family protein [Chloroflexota bacterium]